MNTESEIRLEIPATDGRVVTLRLLDPTRRALLVRSAEDRAEIVSAAAGGTELAGWEHDEEPPGVLLHAGDEGGEDDLDGEWTERLYTAAYVEVPSWWVEVHRCPHEQCCSCGTLTLAEAVRLVPEHARHQVVSAHLDLMAQVSGHYEEAITVAGGQPSSELCVGCVADMETHLTSMAELLAELGHDLSQAYAQGVFAIAA